MEGFTEEVTFDLSPEEWRGECSEHRAWGPLYANIYRQMPDRTVRAGAVRSLSCHRWALWLPNVSPLPECGP